MQPIKQSVTPATSRHPFDLARTAGYNAALKYGALLTRLKKLHGLPKSAVKESLPLPKAVRSSPVTS